MLVIKDIPELTDTIISNLVDYHKTNLLPRYKKLQDYYEAKHDILEKTVSDSSKPNNMLVNDYPGYITNMATGYFIGKPVSYKSKSNNDAYIEELQNIFDYNDEADENNEIAKTCSISGEAFELLFQDESGKTRFTQIQNNQTIVVYDTKVVPTISLAIRYYEVTTVDNKTATKIEVYTKDRIKYYTQNYSEVGGGLTLDKEQEHFFKEVPVIHYLNNNELMGDFEKVITLIDAYDKAQSNNLDDMDYFTEAYLKIKNMSGTDKEDLNKIKENRVILVDGDGDADWLIKDVNDSAIENFKKRLNTDIHKFSATPDLTDEKFGDNLSGISIKFKLFCLEQLAIMKERKFKRALQRRIELISNILAIRGSNTSYTDIDVTFTRNIPANLTELVDMASKLKGIVSDETLLSQMPFVDDVASELDKMKKQQEEQDTLIQDMNNVTTMNNVMSGANNG